MNSVFEGTDAYLVSADLRDAVNVAVTLEKPLLIKGFLLYTSRCV